MQTAGLAILEWGQTRSLEPVHFPERGAMPHNVGWTHPDELNKAFLDFSPCERPGGAATVGSEVPSGRRRAAYHLSRAR